MVNHWKPRFNFLELQCNVGANCERMVRVVGDNPFKGRWLAPRGKGWIGQVAAGHGYSSATIPGSIRGRAVTVDCYLTG